LRWIEGLDHPLLFVLFAGMAIIGLFNCVKWGADRANLVGLKSAVTL